MGERVPFVSNRLVMKLFGGKEYLLIEWKSGDYRYGGRESSYYVMTKE